MNTIVWSKGLIQIQAESEPWWGQSDGIIVVAKRAVPNDLCDCRDYPGCSGPLYRWTKPTPNDYWPVIRCENHLKLQRLRQEYVKEWYHASTWWEQSCPLPWGEWLEENWDDDTSGVGKVFKYWRLSCLGE